MKAALKKIEKAVKPSNPCKANTGPRGSLINNDKYKCVYTAADKPVVHQIYAG